MLVISTLLCIFFFWVFQAVQNGLWVVFEDVDKAPSDVQSILLPLLEGGNTFSTGRGEVLSFSFSIDFDIHADNMIAVLNVLIFIINFFSVNGLSNPSITWFLLSLS